MVGDDGGHRLDGRSIDLAQLLDPAEDIAQLGRKALGFGVGDRDPREARDPLYGCGVYGHAAAASRAAALHAMLFERVTHRNAARSEEHTSELQSLMRSSYAVFCLKNQNNKLTMEHIDPT